MLVFVFMGFVDKKNEQTAKLILKAAIGMKTQEIIRTIMKLEQFCNWQWEIELALHSNIMLQHF